MFVNSLPVSIAYVQELGLSLMERDMDGISVLDTAGKGLWLEKVE